jgi:hypothetical protein
MSDIIAIVSKPMWKRHAKDSRHMTRTVGSFERRRQSILQVRRDSFDFSNRDATAAGVVIDLVAVDTTDGEILRGGVVN